jgi:DeoR/GlpR family transcriptional regulator of sugar metabolism
MTVQLPSERRLLIQRRLEATGRVSASDLAGEFRTSEDTIRRDLRELAAAGLCKKVYGGALPPTSALDSIEMRDQFEADSKATLASIAVRLLSPGQFVALDAGSTNLAIARALPRGMALSVVSNAPAVASVLAGRPEIDLHLLGGRYDPRSGGVLGTRTCRQAAELRPHIVFVGACAVDAARGVTAFSPEEADLKQVLVGSAATVVTVATADKLGKSATFAVVSADRLDHLITELGAPSDVIVALRSMGVNVAQPSMPALARPHQARPSQGQ